MSEALKKEELFLVPVQFNRKELDFLLNLINKQKNNKLKDIIILN